MAAEGISRAKASLAALFDENAAFLVRQARRFAPPGVDPEDVVQDVFLVAHRRLDELDPERAGGWLYRVMRNVVREHQRRVERRARREEVEAAARPPTTHSVERDDVDRRRERLQRCLQQLPPRQREAVVLCELEELSAREAADLLGTTEAAVFTLLTRGRRALKQAWLDEEATVTRRDAA